MVKGADALHRRFQKVPLRVREELVKVLEQSATEMVAEMKALAPVPEIAAALKWSWGDAPAGAISIGTLGDGGEFGKLKVSIFVEKGEGAAVDAWFAHFFEFGTAPRFTKEGAPRGQIVAQPFFWPVWRSNRKRVRARLSRAVSRGLKQV